MAENQLFPVFDLPEIPDNPEYDERYYPSVYFDFYDKIINDANYVNIENNVLEKINNYCVFLKKVAKFQIFNEIVEDFKWIK